MEVKTTVSTAELLPLISALKLEMQKKGYSPLSIRGLENVWDALLHYASTVPKQHLMKISGRDSYKLNTVFAWIWNTPCTVLAGRWNS